MIKTQPTFERGLYEGERGTRIIAGRPYHWGREQKVDFLKAERVEVLHLYPGVDPAEPGTCTALSTVLRRGVRKCSLDWPHQFHDHRTVDGMQWPNPDRIRIVNPNDPTQELVMTDEYAAEVEKHMEQRIASGEHTHG